MKKIYILLSCLILVLIFVFIYIYFFGIKSLLTFELVGDDVIYLNVGDDYEELGAKAFYQKSDIVDSVVIKGEVDCSVVGTYYVEYTVNYKKISKKLTRTVVVVDKISPVIKLKGSAKVNMFIGDSFVDPGVEVSDNYDKDLNAKVEVLSNIDPNKEGSYVISYTVVDSSGNKSSVTREVIYKEKIIVDGKQKVAVLNYHFFYDPAIGESCNESICEDVKDFRAQLDYLKANNYKTLTMEEFRAWMYGEINIPEKSVLITVDDGAMGTGKHNGNKLIPILEEYQMHATLFLITGWWDISNYQSEYLDVESHSYDMHTAGVCNKGPKMLCLSKEKVIEDLNNSISITNSKKAFCFPFYAYNSSTIQSVKDVGFKLAFVGGYRKANRLDDKYKIPRFPIQKNTSLNEFIRIVS